MEFGGKTLSGSRYRLQQTCGTAQWEHTLYASVFSVALHITDSTWQSADVEADGEDYGEQD